ncbi:MAG: T9SS type A sorting domain-containing protein [Flavobacterium sp.]|nr:MAG: T9SS type A sorting domain-containing protein [Flavobacterium sp.]
MFKKFKMHFCLLEKTATFRKNFKTTIMKKTLLALLLVAAGGVQAQNLYSYGFDPTVNDLAVDGWVTLNRSASPTATVWTLASYDGTDDTAPFGGLSTPGQDGAENSFALVNYTSTSGGATSTISNWLFTPTIEVQNGDVVTFYTRIGKNTTPEDPDASYADRLQLRMSTTGDASTQPTAGPTQLGSYTTLLADVNPNLTLTDYPTSWDTGLITSTISGLAGPTMVKFAFRYFVTNAGPSGANSDIIGIDTFSVDRPTAGTSDFFATNFRMYPNPASSVINLSSATTQIQSAQLTDVNGRIVKNVSFNGVSEAQINIADLNTGVYFLKVQSALGTGTAKVIKN